MYSYTWLVTPKLHLLTGGDPPSMVKWPKKRVTVTGVIKITIELWDPAYNLGFVFGVIFYGLYHGIHHHHETTILGRIFVGTYFPSIGVTLGPNIVGTFSNWKVVC